MSFTVLHGASPFDTANKLSNPGGTRITGTITTDADDIIYACLYTRGGVDGSPLDTPTISGLNISWVLVIEKHDGTADDATNYIGIWRGVADGTDGAITWTYTGASNSSNAGWHVVRNDGDEDGTGDTASDTGATTGNKTLDLTFEDANSEVLTFGALQSATPDNLDTPTDFTQIDEDSHSEAATWQTAWKDTNTDPVWNVDAAVDWVLAAVELLPLAAGPDAAVIAEGVGTDDRNSVVGITSYDASATSHDVYRNTATMSGDPEANGVRVGEDVDPDISYVDGSVAPDTVYFYALVSRDGSGDTPSNEITFRTAPARPTVLWEGENLVPFPEMDTDTDTDGLVDGFVGNVSGAHTVAFNVIQESQRIQVTASTGAGGSRITSDAIAVTAGVEYSFVPEVSVANVVGSFKGQAVILWYNGGFISDAVVEFNNTSFADVTVIATAPAGATSAKVRTTAVTVLAGDTGDTLTRHARFFRTDHQTATTATVSWVDNTGGLRSHVVHDDGFPRWTAAPGEEKAELTGLTPDEEITVIVLALGPGGEFSGYSEQVVFTPEAPEPPPVAEVIGTLAHFNFSVSADPIRTTGAVQRQSVVDGVAALVNRDGFLTDVQARDAPMEWLAAKTDVLPTAVQALSLFGAATNVETLSADFTGWSLSNVTVTPNAGIGANKAIEADKIDDASASLGYAEKLYTVTDDSTVWVISAFITRDPDATVVQRLLVEFTGGSPEITGKGIDFDISDGSFQLLGSPLTGGVVDLGSRYRVYVVLANNSNGNTSLKSRLYPAHGTVLGTPDATSQGSILAWGHDVKNKPFLSPHVATSGAQASHAARRYLMDWTAGPGAFVGYLALFPWMVAGAGGVPESYRLFTLGGDTGILGQESFAIYLDGDTVDKITAQLRNDSGSAAASVTNGWLPGELLEVYWKLASNGVINMSVAVNWGAFVDSSPGSPLTLPTDWYEQVAALNSVTNAADRQGSASYQFAKFESDVSLTALDMRDLFLEASDGF